MNKYKEELSPYHRLLEGMMHLLIIATLAGIFLKVLFF